MTITDVLRPRRLPVLIAALLTAATVFFLWGALAERSGHRESAESAEEIGREGEDPESHSEAEEGDHSETAEEQAAEAEHNDGEAAGEHSEETEYRPLGVNLESIPLLVAGAVLSLALAGFAVRRPRREVLLAVLALTVGFTALEMAEVGHQAEIDQTGLLVLALIAGVLHAAAAVVAALALMSGRRTRPHVTVG